MHGTKPSFAFGPYVRETSTEDNVTIKKEALELDETRTSTIRIHDWRRVDVSLISLRMLKVRDGTLRGVNFLATSHTSIP